MSAVAKKKTSAAPRVRPAFAFPEKEVSLDAAKSEIIGVLALLSDLRDGLDLAAARGAFDRVARDITTADPNDFVSICTRVHQIRMRLDLAIEFLWSAEMERGRLAADWLESQ